MAEQINALQLKITNDSVQVLQSLEQIIQLYKTLRKEVNKPTKSKKDKTVEGLKEIGNELDNLKKKAGLVEILGKGGKLGKEDRAEKRRLDYANQYLNTLARIDKIMEANEKRQTVASQFAARTKFYDTASPLDLLYQKKRNTESALTSAIAKGDDTKAVALAERLLKIKEQILATEHQIANATKDETDAAKETAKAMEEVAKASRSAKKHTTFMSTLLRSIGRIAFYRAIRTMMKNFTQGIAEGIKNLYQWSEAFNTNFAPTLDTFKTQMTYLKNGFASMFSPLIEWVVPNVIVPLTDALVELFNLIQQSFAALVGHNYWYKAQKSMQKFAETTKKANIQLAKFDELNNLTETGSGSDDDATGMFTLEKVWDELSDSGIGSFARAIKKALEDIKSGFNGAFVANTEKLETDANRIRESWARVFSNPDLKQALDDLSEQAGRTAGAIVGSATSIATSFAVGVTGGVADATEKMEDFNTIKLTKITENVTGILEKTEGIADAAAEVAKAYESEGFQNFVSTIYSLADAAVVNALDKVSGFFDDIFGYFTTPYVENAGLFRSILEEIFKIFDKLTSPLQNITDNIMKSGNYEDSWFHRFITDLTDRKSQLFETVLTKIRDWLVRVNEKLDQWKQKWNEAKEKFANAIDAINKAFGLDGFKNIFDWIYKVSQKLAEWSTNWKLAKDDCTNAIKGVKDALGLNGFQGLRDWLQKIIDKLKEWRSEWSLADLSVDGAIEKIRTKLNQTLSFPKIKLPHFTITEVPLNGNVARWFGLSSYPKVNVEWYAKGGFPDLAQGSLFAAGEVPGQAEMVGNINGRTGVASGFEITGIRDAVLSTGETEASLLTRLISALERKQLVIAPSAQLGRVMAQSNRMYGAVTG